MAYGTTTYIDAITGLRTLAVLLVFACHTYVGVLPGGFIGVDIFFVISGYLITSILLKEAARTGSISLSSFYKRRAFRILPASLFCTLLVYLGAPWLLSQGGEDAGLNAVASTLSFMNWLRALTTTTGGALGHYWSLAVEEQFYAFWSLIVLAAALRGHIRSVPAIAAILLVASMAWRTYLWLSGAGDARIYNGLDTHSDGLLIGCILAGLKDHPAVARIASFWPIACAALMIELVLFDAASPWLWLQIPVASATAAVIVSSAIAGGNLLSRLMATAPMVYLGKRSYSFYLWHFPVVSFFFASGISRSLWFLPSLLICLAISEISYRLIESPFLQWKDRRPDAAGAASA